MSYFNTFFTYFSLSLGRPISANHARRGLAAAISIALLSLSNTALADAPVAVNDSRTISMNSSITLNLISNDFDADGDVIYVIEVGASSNATIVLNSDGSVFYTPNEDFQGTDTFTYTIQEDTEEALTATGTVTITVSNSDFVAPSADGNNRRIAVVMDTMCTRLRESSDSELGAQGRNLLERCNALDAMAENNPDALNEAFKEIAPEETIALMRVSSQSNRAQTAAVSQRIGQLQAGNNSFTLNGVAAKYAAYDDQYAGGSAGDGEPIWSALGFFASVQYDSAERDATDLESGYDSDGGSLTFGADYRLNNEWVVGGALGLTQNDLDYSSGNGSLESEITTFMAFGSYSKGRLAIESQLGYAFTSFDSLRNVSYAEGESIVVDSMYGSTEGSQLLLNTQVQWEWNKEALTVYPFARLDYMQNDVDAYGESGEGSLPMMMSAQSSDSLTLGAGVQGNYVLNQSWGVLIPTAQFTLLSELTSGYDPIVARFAFDPVEDNNFVLQNDGGDSSYSQLAIGSSAIFKGGVSAFLQYQQMIGYDHLSAFQIQAGVRYEF